MFGLFRGSSNETKVSVEEAYELIQSNKDILILDVRTPAEFKAGHIKNAKNIPYDVLPVRINEIDRYKEKIVLVHCQSGGRSSSAVNTLEKNGFVKIYHMNRGLGAWKYEIVK